LDKPDDLFSTYTVQNAEKKENIAELKKKINTEIHTRKKNNGNSSFFSRKHNNQDMSIAAATTLPKPPTTPPRQHTLIRQPTLPRSPTPYEQPNDKGDKKYAKRAYEMFKPYTAPVHAPASTTAIPPPTCGCEPDPLKMADTTTTLTDTSGNEIYQNGNNWTGNNVSTLLSWLTNANYNIQCLDISIEDCSQTIRHNVILGLLLSTSAGTISVANIGIISKQHISIIMNIVFTIMSYIIAINTGRIKVYQIQERLEQFIKLKQEWTYFITTIAVEFQTPVNLRKDALQLILNNKEKYLDLMKRDCEFTDRAKKEMEKRIQQDTDQWFFLNNEFYNSHVSLLNFSKGIRINDLVDSMSYFEGINLIEAEKSDGYDPNKNIAPFYDKVDKYKVIRHFYEIDIEESRRKSMWDFVNEILFPNYFKELKNRKRDEMHRKRKERVKKELEELEEEEERLFEVYEKYKRSTEQAMTLQIRDDDYSSEEKSSSTPDIENQIGTPDVVTPSRSVPDDHPANTWFEYFGISY
jgi:hypothetical protein